MDFQFVADQFHFIRPGFLYLLVPAVALYWILQIRERRSSNWEDAIDRALLPHLLVTSGEKSGGNPFVLLLIVWVLSILAMAGPTWEKIEQPVHEREDALVILFDLSLSMYATDLKPNRLVVARRKLHDLLDARQEGITALVVFAGDAHTVSPLTDDAATIASMVPSLLPEIMPVMGSNLESALNLANQLFADGGATSGRILIMTDEILDMASSQMVAEANRNDFPVSVLGIGTPEGAPVSLEPIQAGAGFLKDSAGTLVVPRLNREALKGFTAVAHGRYAELGLSGQDIEYLLADDVMPDPDQFVELDREFDIWLERGPWLLLLVLPFAALGFRRGWIWVIVPLLWIPSPSAHAVEWNDLWQTSDQQGARALVEGETARAADLFNHPGWKGSAHYRNGDFDEAVETFAAIETSDGHYNRGNALARQGELESAINAYAESLALNPENEDALFNKELLEQLLQQQEQRDQSQDGEPGEDGEEQESEDGQEGQDQDQAEGEQQQGQQQDGQDQGETGDQEPQDSHQAESQSDAGDNPQDQEPNEMQEEQSTGDKEEELAQAERSESVDPVPGSEEDREAEQALQQWLRQIPDDPGGLLRNKFQRQYQRSRDRGDTPKSSQVY